MAAAEPLFTTTDSTICRRVSAPAFEASPVSGWLGTKALATGSGDQWRSDAADVQAPSVLPPVLVNIDIRLRRVPPGLVKN